MENKFKEIERITGLKQITDVFLYGSRAYNTYNKDSDYDFIVLADDIKTNGQQFNQTNINITVYSKEHFQEKLDKNKPFAIECFYLPEDFKILNKTKFNLKLKTFDVEYYLKIKDDLKKLEKVKGNKGKEIRVLFFIKKLNKQLEWLYKKEPFSFEFKEDLEEIRFNVFNNQL
jgi:predicted nucleotidyltransferase